MPIDDRILSIENRIIDGSDSKTRDQLYFIGTADNYVRKSDSMEIVYAKGTGNFQSNSNPVGKDFSDILDGGDSGKSTSQFIAPIIGGVFPTRKSGI
jgi:hypothetical protein